MTDEHSDLARRLLSAGAAEAPSAAAKARTIAAITTAGGAAGAAAATSATHPQLLTIVAKWLCIGATGGVVVSGALVGAEALLGNDAPPRAAVSAPGVSTPRTPLPRAPSASTPRTAPETYSVAPQPTSSTGRALPRPSASVTASTPAERLRLELRRLRSARQAIQAGQARQGLALLNSYRSEFPRRQMEDEATVLEVEAWLALGERQRAQALADGYLRRRPDSAHRSRLKRLLRTP